MKKITLLPLAFLLCSCGLHLMRTPEEHVATELFENFMSLLVKEDGDSIFDLFAPTIKEELPSLREDVDKLTGFYDGGAFVKETLKGCASSESYHYGELWERILCLDRVVTCENRSYLFCIEWKDVDQDNPEKVGIHSIFIEEYYPGDPEVAHSAYKGIEINYGIPLWRAEQRVAVELFDGFLSALTKEDGDSIYGLFAQSIKAKIPSLREDVDELLDFYGGGDFVKWIRRGGGLPGHTYRYGEMVERNFWIHRIFQSEAGSYSVCLRWRDVDKNEPDNVGIQSLYIEGHNPGDRPVEHYIDEGVEINCGDPAR